MEVAVNRLKVAAQTSGGRKITMIIGRSFKLQKALLILCVVVIVARTLLDSKGQETLKMAETGALTLRRSTIFNQTRNDMRQIMMAQAVTVRAEAAEVTTTINLLRHLVRSSPVEVVVAALPQVAGVETIKAKVTTKAVVTTAENDYNPW